MSSPEGNDGGTSGWKAGEITKARIRDLKYYLGDEWIDYNTIAVDAVIAKYKKLGTSAYQPKKCPVCKKYWSYTIDNRAHAKLPVYLKQIVFGGLPAEDEICHNC